MKKWILKGVMLFLVLLVNLGALNIEILANSVVNTSDIKKAVNLENKQNNDPTGERVVETTEQVSVETAEQVSVETTEQVSEEATEQVVEETTEQVVEETTEQVVEETTEQVVEETTANNEMQNFSLDNNNAMSVVNTVRFYLDENKIIKYSEERSGVTNQIVKYYEYFKGTKYGEHQGVGKVEKAYDLNTDGKTLKIVTTFDKLGKTIRIAEFYANTIFLQSHDLKYSIVYYIMASNGTIEYSEKKQNGNTKRTELLVYRSNTKYNVNHMNITQISKRFTFRANDSLMEEFYYNALGHITEIHLFTDGTTYNNGTIFNMRTSHSMYRILYLKRDTTNTKNIIYKATDYNASYQRTTEYILSSEYVSGYLNKVTQKFTFRANNSLSEEFFYNALGHHTQTNLFRDGTVYEKRAIKDIWRVVYMKRDPNYSQDIVKDAVDYNTSGVKTTLYLFDPVLYTQNYMGEVIKKFTFRANGSLNEEFYYNQAGYHTQTNLFRDGTVYEKRVINNIWRVVYMQRDPNHPQDILKEVVEYNANGGRTAIHWFDPVLYTQNYMGEVIRTFTFRANGSLNEEFFYNQAGHNTNINVFFDGTNYEKRTVSNVWKAILMQRDTVHNQDILHTLNLYQQSPHKHCKSYAFEPVLYIQDYMSKAHLRADFCGTSWQWPTDSRTITTNYMPNGAKIIGDCPQAWCYPGSVNGGRHYGIDVAGASGANIYAISGGTIIDSGYNNSQGNFIIVNHGNEVYSKYYHMSSLRRSGGSVSKGEVIGYMGNTGLSYGTHLHLQMGKNGYGNDKSVDPANYIPGISYKWS